MKIFLIRRSNN